MGCPVADVIMYVNCHLYPSRGSGVAAVQKLAWFIPSILHTYNSCALTWCTVIAYGPFSGLRRWVASFWGNMHQPPNMCVNSQFQAKPSKIKKTRTISEAMNPIKPKLERKSNDHRLHFVGGLPLPQSKSNVADGRQLEKGYNVIK